MTLSVGTRLGAYEIIGELGVGGMGKVYRARDTKLGRDVAIKALPAALAADSERLARFEREAKLLAGLNHAHIAAVYGLDEHEGMRYLAMELVEGETLEHKLEKTALPVEDALRLALQVAEALEAAHAKGVVHRDLKPANIMVTPDGVVKVLDFGLAKAFAGDPNEASPAHSPDGSWIAYQQQDTNTGPGEINIRPFPDVSRTRIPVGGGTAPVFARDGSELFFFDGRGLAAAPLTYEPRLSVGTPRRLFESAEYLYALEGGPGTSTRTASGS